MSLYTLQHYFGHNYISTGMKMMFQNDEDPMDHIGPKADRLGFGVTDWEELRGTPLKIESFDFKSAKKQAEATALWEEKQKRLKQLEKEVALNDY